MEDSNWLFSVPILGSYLRSAFDGSYQDNVRGDNEAFNSLVFEPELANKNHEMVKTSIEKTESFQAWKAVYDRSAYVIRAIWLLVGTGIALSVAVHFWNVYSPEVEALRTGPPSILLLIYYSIEWSIFLILSWAILPRPTRKIWCAIIFGLTLLLLVLESKDLFHHFKAGSTPEYVPLISMGFAYFGIILVLLTFHNRLEKVLMMSITVLVTAIVIGSGKLGTAQASILVVIAFVLCALLMLLDIELAKSTSIVLVALAAVLAGLMLLSWLPSDKLKLSDGSKLVVAAFSAGLLVSTGWLFVSTMLDALFSRIPYNLKQRTKARLYPQETIIQLLCQTAGHIPEDRDQWSLPKVKKNVIEHLESISQCIEYELFGSVPFQDRVLKQWWMEQTGGAAEGVRSLQKLVISPNDDSRKELVRRLSTALRLSTEGKWNELALCLNTDLAGSLEGELTGASGETAPRDRGLKRMGNQLRNEGSLLVPLVLSVLVIVDPLSWQDSNSALWSTLIFILIPWATSNVIHRIDKDFGAKKDTRDMVKNSWNKIKTDVPSLIKSKRTSESEPDDVPAASND